MMINRLLHRLLSLFVALTLVIGCSTTIAPQRIPASATDEISYYLSVDKFKYYLNEYSVAMDGKVSDEIIRSLRDLSVEEILKMHLDKHLLSNANNYDEIIYQFLQSKGLIGKAKKEDLKWNYNFFRTKLNEAFTITSSKLDIDLSINSGEKSLVAGAEIFPEELNPNDMTLDSGHYISNRTTRAILWDSIEHNHSIEFYLGDSREFLKLLKESKGEILYEVRPLAKNYNKIFIIKYPGETNYRYAITNIGGQDRLNHLVSQLSLSNFSGKKITSHVVIKGDLKKFHAAKTEEHTLQLKLLPKAERVIIGQKESIEGKFNIFWKIRALKNLYDDEPALYSKVLDTKTREKLTQLEHSPLESIFKDKKIIEDSFNAFEAEFEKNPKLLPPKFKVYNYDNFTIEMCDYVFEDATGKNIRWRVVSNVWGDEIVPIAQAFKNTGHDNIVYMGTAGAFANKGYKVGDLVIPSAVQDYDQKLLVKSQTMKIEGAKYGGSVEHVGSPFEESVQWLEKARARSEFVEVETSYLRKIFNSPTDNVEMYLLISDILGSETETLAHATSAKRKNAQNKLLASLFFRDAKGVPRPIQTLPANSIEKVRSMVFKVLANKPIAYQYYAYSKLKDSKNLSEKEILAFADKNPTFSDSFLLERLVRASEEIHELNKSVKGKFEFDIAFPKSLIEGKWNPKADKLEIILITKNAADEKILKTQLATLESHLKKFKPAIEISISKNIPSPDFVWMKIPEKTDPDFLVRVYSITGLKNAGLYHKVTYNGNLTLDLLPIDKTESPYKAFYQGKDQSCLESMRAFLSMF